MLAFFCFADGGMLAFFLQKFGIAYVGNHQKSMNLGVPGVHFEVILASWRVTLQPCAPGVPQGSLLQIEATEKESILAPFFDRFSYFLDICGFEAGNWEIFRGICFLLIFFNFVYHI